ncbi:MAG: hypothetical protein MJ252_07725 [archaeon]|nr:hypothetical protein [archaeon]
MEYDNTNPQTEIQIITRLRGPLLKKEQIKKEPTKTKTDNSNSALQKRKTYNPSQNSTERKSKSPMNKSPLKNTSDSSNLNKLSENTKYTMFTSNHPSNTMIVSAQPILGKSINKTFESSNDLYEFSHSILKDISPLEFDQIYNETVKLDLIYEETLKKSITNLFHGKNASVITFGPIDGGKSYLLRGGAEQKGQEQGLLSRAIDDILNLIELSRQANNTPEGKLKNKHDYVIKLSAIQIYLDTISDLLSKEAGQIKIERYIDETGNVNCNLLDLTEREIRNKIEYDLCIKDAVNQRKWLTQVFKVNDLKRKSHFIISIKIQKKEKLTPQQSASFVRNQNDANISKNSNSIVTMESSIDNYAQIDFVELASSNFGFMSEKEIGDESLNGIIHKNTSKVFNSLSSNLVAIASGTKPKTESKLTLTLKKTLRPGSTITFFNCVIPWECPLNQSFKALKFTNWLRNQVLNLNENTDLRMGGNTTEGEVFGTQGTENINDNPNEKNSRSQLLNTSDNLEDEEYSKRRGMLSKGNIKEDAENSREYNNKLRQRGTKSLGPKNRIITNIEAEIDPNIGRDAGNISNISQRNRMNISTNIEPKNRSKSPILNYSNKERILNSSNPVYPRTNLNLKKNFLNGDIQYSNKSLEPIDISNEINEYQRKRNPMINSSPMSYKNMNQNMSYQGDIPGNITRLSVNDPVNRSMYPDLRPNRYNINNSNMKIRIPSLKDNPNLSSNQNDFISTGTTKNISRENKDRHYGSIPSNLSNINNDMLNYDNNYSSGEEQEVRMLRQRAANKYSNKSPMNQNINPMGQSEKEMPPLQNESQEQKLKNLEDSLRVLQERSFEMNQQLENMRQERGFPNPGTDDSRYCPRPTSVSYMPDADFDKMKQDQATLKTDNIILREDINRLSELNKHLEEELSVQRSRNLELAAESERLTQEKLLIENENLKLKEDLAKSKIDEKNLTDNFNQKIQMENNLKQAESDLGTMREEKAKFEVEYRVLKEKFDSLQKNYNDISEAYSKMKNNHDEEVEKIEQKVDLMSKEIDNLQKENFGLRANDEKQRQELSTMEKLRDQYKEKYQEQKNKNIIMNQKLAEIEEDFRALMKDKENESNLKKKEEEIKKMKLESKNKIVNEFQNRIANFRNERLRKKNEENAINNSNMED